MIFLWGVCSKVVAKNKILGRRKIATESLSQIYREQEETIEHVLQQCDRTRAIWFGLDINYKVQKDQVTCFDSWLLDIRKMVLSTKADGTKLFVLIAYTYWIIWKERCRVIRQGKMSEPDKVVCRIKQAVQERMMIVDSERKLESADQKKENIGRWKKPG